MPQLKKISSEITEERFSKITLLISYAFLNLLKEDKGKQQSSFGSNSMHESENGVNRTIILTSVTTSIALEAIAIDYN